MLETEVQKLDDISIIQGQYKIINAEVYGQDNALRDISNLASKFEITQYGNKDNIFLTINGVKTDDSVCTFTLTSEQSRLLSPAKYWYFITLQYGNGNENKGVGFFTVV